ncbi:EAL domain-containing protein [Ventrimonas sp. CLA-AP-H27]|uniref:EAL domain-containing protein n=2 Tax=Ventrimonas faecis TaxID=3133170 RepID=A0ABV1HIK2_9FIRM
MKSSLVLPFCLILIFQTVFMMVFLSNGMVARSLYTNEINFIEKDVQNSELLLEREMVQHWLNDIRTSTTVQKKIQSVLDEQAKKPEDIQSDWALNAAILDSIMPDVLDLLHRSYGNSIYVILNGPASGQSRQGHKAGVAVMDTDSSSFAADNSDLLLLKGAASISSDYKIPLAGEWQMDYDMSMDASDAYRFYNPFSIAKGTRVLGSTDRYGYFGEISSALQEDTAGVCYSIPLVVGDGAVIGILGGTMTKGQIYALLKNELFHSDADTIQMIARRESGSYSLTPVLTYGSAYNRCFGKREKLSFMDTEWQDIKKIIDENGDSWYLTSMKLPIYGSDSPYVSTEWQTVVLRRQSVMESFYQKLLNGLLWGCAFTLLPGILFALLYGEYFTRPIRRLIGQLRSAESGSRIRLQRTWISELDELSRAIEILSADVVESALRISRILDASGLPIGVFEYLPDQKKVFCSRSLFELLGIQETDEDYTYLEPEGFAKMMQVLGNGIRESEDVSLYQISREHSIQYLRLKIVKAGNGNQTGVLLDATEEVEKQQRLERERDYDQLTDLYNRGAFRRSTEALLGSGKLSCAALIMWDLDNLKYVNDTYGHEMGDRYIRLFADQLKRLSSLGAVVERHSGDEFMAFLCGDSEEQIREEIRQFFCSVRGVSLKVDEDYELPLRASAGVTWYPRQARDFASLTRYADFAMYMAKHSTKGVLQEFDFSSYQKNSYLLSGREELNQLLERDDVPFAVQPILSRNGSIFGYEALMRPNSKNLKNIQEVLTLAKRQAKLPQFERLTWVCAMKWFRDHEAELPAGSRLFVNSIANTSLAPECLEELIRLYPDLLKRVVLEVTEGEEINSSDMGFKTRAVERTGGMVALDDFGSGYSSEESLLNLNINIVKLDMELVQGIDENPDKQELAANLIHYCKERGILVLAEGVERIEELHTMLMLGADLFQGYYLGRPELEIRPVNPYVVEKLRVLSQK